MADAGYRSEAVMAQVATTQPDTELVITLGREGKELAKPRDARHYPHTVARAAKCETGQGQIDYRKRKWIAEPPNGWIKNVPGFRQFSVRGLDKAKAEFKLVCLALNLRTMGAMGASWVAKRTNIAKAARLSPMERVFADGADGGDGHVRHAPGRMSGI